MDTALEPWFIYGMAAIGVMTGVLVAEMLLQAFLRTLGRIVSAQPLDRAIGAAGLMLGVLIGSAICVPFAIASIGSQASVFRPLLIVGILGMAGIIGMLFAWDCVRSCPSSWLRAAGGSRRHRGGRPGRGDSGSAPDSA